MNDETLPAPLILFLMAFTGIITGLLVGAMLRGDTVLTLFYGVIAVAYWLVTGAFVAMYATEPAS